MGTDFNIKPVGAPVATPFVRPAPAAPVEAVQTQLPPSQTVTAADTVVTVRSDSNAQSDALSRQVSIDRAAAQVVYKVVDSRTSLVIRQFPDEALLRSRAYGRALEDARLTARKQVVTDRRV